MIRRKNKFTNIDGVENRRIIRREALLNQQKPKLNKNILIRKRIVHMGYLALVVLQPFLSTLYLIQNINVKHVF